MLKRWIGWEGLVSASLALALAAGLWLSDARRADRAEAQAAALRLEIAQFDRETGEVGRLKDVIQDILARRHVVITVQRWRYATGLLEELARRRPQGVYLASLRDDRRTVFITGFAASPREVDAFLANLAASPLLEEVSLLARPAEAAPRYPGYPHRFTVQAKVKARA